MLVVNVMKLGIKFVIHTGGLLENEEIQSSKMSHPVGSNFGPIFGAWRIQKCYDKFFSLAVETMFQVRTLLILHHSYTITLYSVKCFKKFQRLELGCSKILSLL